MTLSSFSAVEKNVRIIIPEGLDINGFDNYKQGSTADAKLEKGDIRVVAIASDGNLKVMKISEKEVNENYKYMEIFIKNSEADAKVKLSISYKVPGEENYVILGEGIMSEEKAAEIKVEYAASLDDLIELNESSYDDFIGVVVEDKSLVSILSIGNDEIFSLTRDKPSNILAKFTSGSKEIDAVAVPVLETESDSFKMITFG